MGRPGLALGTAGKIRLHATPSGHRAVAWYRDYDGKCRQVERSAKTKAAAEAALRLALRDRARIDAGGDIAPDTRVSVLAEAWFAGLTNLSPTTMQVYRHRLDQQILPGLGSLRVRELSVGTIERHLRLIADKHGPAMAKMTKSVLSGSAAWPLVTTRSTAIPSVTPAASRPRPRRRHKPSPPTRPARSFTSSPATSRPGGTTCRTSWPSCSPRVVASAKQQP